MQVEQVWVGRGADGAQGRQGWKGMGRAGAAPRNQRGLNGWRGEREGGVRWRAVARARGGQAA